jgi:anti-sigma factor RsiW
VNCRGWNPQIALYVEGDLEPEFARQLERHLDACEECRRFALAFQESQSEVRQLRSEVLSAAALDRVRAKVLQQVYVIEARRTWMGRLGIWFWGGFRLHYAVLSSVALILGSIVAWRLAVQPLPSATPTLPTATTVTALQPPASAQTVAKRSVKWQAAIVRRSKGRVLPVVPETIETEAAAGVDAAMPQETLVQIQTDDPNVVIYWLVDQPGGF